MYCNYYLSLADSITAVVTEIDSNPGNKVPVSIRAGYAFDSRNRPVDFWPLVTKNFADTLAKKYNFNKVNISEQPLSSGE